MDIEKLEAIIEAVLFTMGNSVPVNEIAATIDQDVNTTRKILHTLMDKYRKDTRGIQIIELEDCFQMCTKSDYYEYLIKLVNQPKRHVLTEVMLETLSIIAYKQPVTRAEIEGIRGVKCDHAVNKLMEYNLVCEVGRKDAPGRPILFGTTEDFLRCFGVSAIDDLPVVDAVQLEDLKKEALEEAQMTLDEMEELKSEQRRNEATNEEEQELEEDTKEQSLENGEENVKVEEPLQENVVELQGEESSEETVGEQEEQSVDEDL